MKKLSILIAMGIVCSIAIAKPSVNVTTFETYSKQMQEMSAKYISAKQFENANKTVEVWLNSYNALPDKDKATVAPIYANLMYNQACALTQSNEMYKALKALKECPYDVYGVFSVQEEVGIRGANVAAHNINPTFGFGLDTTIAYDLPDSKPEEQITKLGGGVAIKLMDASTICDYRMVQYQKQIAEKYKIKWQPEVLPMGGTDTAGIQRMGKTGAIAGAISIPTRHLHQVIEMAHKADIEASILLLKHALENLDKFDWSLK